MREVVNVVRRPSFPGVELIEASGSTREWGHQCSTFAFGSMRDWNGSLDYRRRKLNLASGDTFLFDAGELFHAVPFEGRAGAFRVLEFAPETFEAACRAEGSNAPVHFAHIVTKVSPQLEAALDALQAALLRDAEPLEQQSRLAVLAHAAVTTVLEQVPRKPSKPAPLGPCARLREILHSTESTQLNLSDFARNVGVSQFQLLRTFKRHYGYPPHAYGLHVRVERARQMLRRGFTVAQAAAANDFTDQSHLTRHFRRIWGVTPGVYASGTASALPQL
jgi:AraC-like DNA-binding protein